jgi:hypothetical protein
MFILRRFLYIFAVGLLFLSADAKTQQISAAATPAKNRVQLKSAVKVMTAKNSPAYLISFSFDFGPMSSVYVKGLGLIPSTGNYQFISNQQELLFSDPTTGAILERLPLKETTVVAAEPPLNEIPRDNQFSQGITAYTWDSHASLQERANAVLAQYFNYFPHENAKLTYLATTYTPLPLDKKFTDQGITAQLALLLSFPYDPVGGKYSFHIQYSTREGRALSDDLRSTDNKEILQAAKIFVDRIVTEMKAGK